MRLIRNILLAIATVIIFGTPGGATVLKIATIAPEGSAWMKVMRRGVDEIKERTNGRVSIKLYGGGVMGNEKSVLRKIRIGQLHGGAFTSVGLMEVYPDIGLYGIPLIFHSLDEIDYVRKRMDPVLTQGLDEAGYVSFGFAAGGFAMLMSNSPVRRLEDLEKRKIWVPEGDRVSYEVMKELGLSPVTLPISDVLTGLQTGLVDIIGSPPIVAVALQWHTKVKYVTETPLAYSVAALAIDKKVFQKLSAEDQGTVREVMSGIYSYFDKQNRRDNQEAAQALRDQGLEFIKPAAEDIDTLRKTAHTVALRFGESDLFTPALFKELQSHLKAFAALSDNQTGHSSQ